MSNDLSLFEFFEMFPDDASAERWFVEHRWPNGVACPHCQSENIQERTTHPQMPFRCRADGCRRFFSAKTDTLMHGSKLGYRKWLMAMYLIVSAKKGISSLDLAAKIKVSERTAWYLNHRIRDAWSTGQTLFAGTVEADETYVGGHDRWRHMDKKRGRGSQTPVVGAKERETGKIQTVIAPQVNRDVVQYWLELTVAPTATLYTDQASVYVGAQVANHDSVNHKRKQYVKGNVHTNGIESHWALLKRGHHGTYHSWSEKHLHRYLREFAGRFNGRDLSTVDRLAQMVQNMVGRRLSYAQLTA